MPSDKAGRRLAAILAANVVDYERLIKVDESATFAAMHTLRSTVIDPLLAEHKGTIAKLVGDEILAEFGSAADAARCAAAIQEGLKRRQEAVASERRIVLQIGIDVGDVTVEGDGLRGDSVDFAARLMKACNPGGVLISAAAQDQLPGKPQPMVDDAGEQQVEGAPGPVQIYRLRLAKSLEYPAPSGGISRIAVAALAMVVLGGAYLLIQSRMPANPVAEDRPARQDIAEQTPPPSAANEEDTDPNIWGNLDAIGSDGSLKGWATDIRDPSDNLTIYLYASGRDPTGSLHGFSGCIETNGGAQDKVCGDFTFLGRIVAKQPYDVPAEAPERARGKEHGFSFAIPGQFRDGERHYFYGYVIPRGHEYEADALLRGESPNGRELIYLYGSPQVGAFRS